MNRVVVENLQHTYPAKRPVKIPRQALKGVSFAVASGEIFGLLGPNGGGKTTTFHILATLLRPTAGTARIFDADVVREPGRVREKLGVVFQHPSLDKKLTVRENLWHQGHLYGMSGAALEARMAEVLRRVALTDRSNDLTEVLSGGLRRRVELAKGLLHRPGVLLLDEPSTGLDPGARHDLWEYLQELKSQGMTILVTTHLMEEAEKCDRVVILNEGNLVASGTPAALKDQIGGDVITVDTAEPQRVADAIRQRFGGEPVVLGAQVRIERERGHEFIPQLISAFPGEISSITLGKPTLEDVFIKRTGHRFWSEELLS